jgi:hypothetical protein
MHGKQPVPFCLAQKGLAEEEEDNEDSRRNEEADDYAAIPRMLVAAERQSKGEKSEGRSDKERSDPVNMSKSRVNGNSWLGVLRRKKK